MALQDDILRVGLRILLAVVYLVVGLWLIRKFRNLFERTLESNKLVKPGFATFFGSFIAFFLKYLLMTIVFSALGLDTSTFWVAMAAVVLALAFSLEESMSNMAAGLMLLTFEYYGVGDIVVINGQLGTVVAVHMYTTELVTADGCTVFVGNGHALNNNIVSLTEGGRRNIRLNLPFGISYSDDIHKARQSVMAVLNKSPFVLQDPKPEVVVVELGDNSVNLLARPWVSPAAVSEASVSRGHVAPSERKFDFVANPAVLWFAGYALIDQIKRRLDADGLSIPFPQRDAHFDIVPGIAAPVKYPEWTGLRQRPGGADAFFRRPKAEAPPENPTEPTSASRKLSGAARRTKDAFTGAARSMKGMFKGKSKKSKEKEN